METESPMNLQVTAEVPAKKVVRGPIRPEIIAQVNQLMKTGFEISEDKLVPEATLIGDLGLDSLDAVDMLVYIEETLGVKVEGDRLASVKTLEDVYHLAAESLSAEAHSG